MIEAAQPAGFDRLAGEVGSGRAHTVRVCFADHYGVLRGRRIAAEHFVARAQAPQAFCDGALVWDIRCEIFEEADFTNYRTGYPDLFVRPELDTLRPCGWVRGEHMLLGDAHDAHGRPLDVCPRRVLRRVLDRVGEPVTVSARLELRVPDPEVAAGWAPGRPSLFAERLLEGLRASGLPVIALEWSRPRRVMTLSLAPSEPVRLADSLVFARTAAREIAAAQDVRLTAMPRIAADDEPTTLRLDVTSLEGEAVPGVAGRLDDVELLLRPLPLGYGPPVAAGEPNGLGALAASDANPYLALAGVIAAGYEESPPSEEGHPGDFRRAISRLGSAPWVADWLPQLLVHDAVALAEREARIRERSVTGWDLARYWECG